MQSSSRLVKIFQLRKLAYRLITFGASLSGYLISKSSNHSKISRMLIDIILWPFDLLNVLMRYRDHFGRFPNLITTPTFNEWLNKQKLINRHSVMMQCADKLAVRAFVSERVSPDILTNILWTGDFFCPTPAFLARLPQGFVIKANHGSAMTLLIKDKDAVNWNSAKETINLWLEKDLCTLFGEWQYRWIPRKIFIEELIPTSHGNPPPDFKFYCFQGKAILTQIQTGRFIDLRSVFVDRKYKRLSLRRDDNVYSGDLQELATFRQYEEMALIAERLAHGFTFVRVDLFYSFKPIFGEMTFHPAAGLAPYYPTDADHLLRKLLVCSAHNESIQMVMSRLRC